MASAGERDAARRSNVFQLELPKERGKGTETVFEWLRVFFKHLFIYFRERESGGRERETLM